MGAAMTDEKFTKIAVKLGVTVRDLFEWGIESGHTTPEQLRLTIHARREKAAKLIEDGMSQRQAAKELGVGQTQIRRDLSPKGSQDEPERRATKAERRAKRELELASKQTVLPDK